jgi:hypothetical protein
MFTPRVKTLCNPTGEVKIPGCHSITKINAPGTLRNKSKPGRTGKSGGATDYFKATYVERLVCSSN